METRPTVALRVGQSELQKFVPAPWQSISFPADPLKDANFLIVFIDSFLVQDAQGKPDKNGINRGVVFAVPAKNTQTNEMAAVITGGFYPSSDSVPGSYKNYLQADVRREQTHKKPILKAEQAKTSGKCEIPAGQVLSCGFNTSRAFPYVPSRSKNYIQPLTQVFSGFTEWRLPQT